MKDPLPKLSSLETIIERMDNAAETSELSPATRNILEIMQGQGFGLRGTVPATVPTSLFDEFNNQTLKDAVSQIRTDCVRMEARYDYILAKITSIKPSMAGSRPITFI
jgi:hypothetical protein